MGYGPMNEEIPGPRHMHTSSQGRYNENGEAPGTMKIPEN